MAGAYQEPTMSPVAVDKGAKEKTDKPAGGNGAADRPPQREQEATERQFQYPGIPTTCDGSETVVHVETAVSQGSGAYPITSSTNMGGGYNAAVMNGGKNLWG